MKNPV